MGQKINNTDLEIMFTKDTGLKADKNIHDFKEWLIEELIKDKSIIADASRQVLILEQKIVVLEKEIARHITIK